MRSTSYGLGSPRVLESVECLLLVTGSRRDRSNHSRAATAPEAVFEQPRQFAVSVGHKPQPAAGARDAALRQSIYNVTQCQQGPVDARAWRRHRNKNATQSGPWAFACDCLAAWEGPLSLRGSGED